MNDNSKKMLLAIIPAILVLIAIGFGITYVMNNSSTQGESLETLKTNVTKETEDIKTRFEKCSKELFKEDGKTFKDEISKEVQEKFSVVLMKFSELNTFIEESKNNKDLTEETYYTQLSEKITELKKIMTDFDNFLHVNRTNFETTFKEVISLFNKLKEKVVDTDGKNLKAEYKEFQSDFENLLVDITSIAADVENDDKNQEYFDSLESKGKEFIDKIKALAQKMNIVIE